MNNKPETIEDKLFNKLTVIVRGFAFASGIIVGIACASFHFIYLLCAYIHMALVTLVAGTKRNR